MKYILSLLSLVLSVQLFAQTPSQMLMVLDIDDTLKVSHILDPLAAVANGPRVENLYRGMPGLLQSIRTRFPDMPTAYLSNAPTELMGFFHSQFLKLNQFPEGSLILRRDLPSSDHKLLKLRELLNLSKPRYVILMGDNGEKDIQVYDQIRKEYSRTAFFIYIRQVYYSKDKKPAATGQVLLPGQMGFVTPIEVAMDMALKNILSLDQVQALIDNVVPNLLNSAAFEDTRGRIGELSFPRWQDCRDFVWPQQVDRIRWGRDGLVNAWKIRVLKRCSVPPQDD